MVLVPLFQSAEDGDGTQLIRFVHHHRLESPFQCLVFLEILLVFVERGGTDGPQFATRQSRLQNVGGIHGTFATACTHQGVNLVDEENDVALGVSHFLDDAFQTFFKLALVLGSGHQCTHIQRVDLLVLQVLGHITSNDTPGQALHNSGFTCARLTY